MVRSAMNKWAYLKPPGTACPCGEIGAAVLEGGTDRCLSHGHQGWPEAMRWARANDVKLVLSDEATEWLEYQCSKEGIELPEDWTVYQALDLLDRDR